jgi:FdhE protein
MSASPPPDPSAIGRIAPAPFAVLPEPGVLFDRRAARFETLAADHPLGPYLLFLAGLARAQHAVLATLTPPEPPAPERISRSREAAMPPLDAAEMARDPATLDTIRRFFDEARTIDMPAEASLSLAKAASLSDEDLAESLRGLFAGEPGPSGPGMQAFLAGGLQVVAARGASVLDPRSLVDIGPGLCPACGGRPVASVIASWQGAESSRYCACSLCATLWNVVRVKCSHCGSTEGIGYRHLEEAGEGVKAECCETCHTYTKVLYESADPRIEPIADDVASLGLDIALKDEPFRRAAFNPFMLR